jgi:predicted permease
MQDKGDMSLTLGLHQAIVRASRRKAMFALVVMSLGSTLAAVICALAFTHLVTSKPLPYPQQTRLVLAEQVIIDRGEDAHSRALSYPAIDLLHRGARGTLTASVMIDHARDVVVSHPEQPLVNVSYIGGDYAELFAPPMALGRFHGAGEGMAGAPPAVVISHSAWQALFGMREDVLRAGLRTAAGVEFVVIGVTSRGFVEPQFHGPGHRTALWLPWEANPSPRHWGWAATTPTLTLVGRLAPDVSAQQAAERLSLLINARWQDEFGRSSASHAGWSTRVELAAAQHAIAGDSIHVGALLLVSALGLALLALANVTHVLVARVAERTRAFSIQLALGARRRHLFVQMMADMLLLMLPVAAVALAVAAAGFALMRHNLGTMLARLDELSVGWMTVALTISSTLVLAVLLAVVALVSVGPPAAHGVLNAGRQATATKLSRRVRAVLMASQVGVAALLLAISIGLFRDAARILNEQGINLERSTSAFLYPMASASQDASPAQQYGEVRRRLAELPGIESVSQSHSPLQDFIQTAVVSMQTAVQYPVGLKRIDHAYLGITGHGLAIGRNFSAAEIQQGASVALVNAAFARQMERDGKVLDTALSRGGGDPFVVVGVLDDVAYPGAVASEPRLYLPASEAGSNFVIRFRPGQRMSREQFVAFLASVNSGLGVFLYDDLDRQRSDVLLPRRITATATLLIAFVVIVASALGLFGMIEYATGMIRAEIGARLAFGAQSRHIVLMLMRSTLVAVAVGCAASAVVAVLVLPGVLPRFGLPALHLHWLDAVLAVAALVLLAALSCCLAARPLLSQSPARVLREAAR